MSGNYYAMSKFTLRDSTKQDEKFVNDLTKATMREYVNSTWDNVADRDSYYEQNKLNVITTKIIQSADQDIGRISVVSFSERIVLEDIHITKSFQGKGFGKKIIHCIIKDAKNKQLPLELTVLKVNPAMHLYLRLGFKVYKEDAQRFYMKLDNN